MSTILPELNNWTEDGELVKKYMSYSRDVLDKKAFKIEKLLSKVEKKTESKYTRGFVFTKHKDEEDVITWTLKVRIKKDE